MAGPSPITSGRYDLRASEVAASLSAIGRGASIHLGYWDTRPDEPHLQDRHIKALQPKPARDGLTLRMGLHNARANTGWMPWLDGNQALVLFVSSFDSVDERALDDLAEDYPTGPASSVQSHPPAHGSLGDAGRRMLSLMAKPGLNLLPYLGHPGWAEFDLAELAGGGRYFTAWLASYFLAREGELNPTTEEVKLPYVLVPGKPLRAAHRGRYCYAWPGLATTYTGTVDDVFTSLTPQFGITPHIGGLGQWRVASGAVVGRDLHVGVSHWAGVETERSSLTVVADDTPAAIAFERPVHGLVTVRAGGPTMYPGPLGPDILIPHPFLFHLAVVGCLV